MDLPFVFWWGLLGSMWFIAWNFSSAKGLGLYLLRKVMASHVGILSVLVSETTPTFVLLARILCLDLL
jgi:hypothetical protein